MSEPTENLSIVEAGEVSRRRRWILINVSTDGRNWMREDAMQWKLFSDLINPQPIEGK